MRVRQVVWTFFVALGCAIGASQPNAALAGQAPNIVVVMSDDQAYDTVDEMPYVSSLQGLEPLGVLYDNVSMCCPARAAFLTGLYAHHSGVELNTHGERMDDRETIATWLDDGGYETGLFGKYLNGYPFKRDRGEIPPGWDRWAAFLTKPAYYGYDLTLDGERRSYGNDPDDYSTDVLAGEAESFVKSAEQPFFALVAPFGPHGRAIPARRHKGLYRDTDFPVRPNFSEAAEDAPYYYRRLPEPSLGFHQKDWRERMEALQSVDELAERVVSAADERSRETIVVYLSDNGYSQGSHDWPRKRCGYEECGRVPGLIRAPGDPSGLLASMVDLAPTLTDLAGVDRETTDGRSLVPYFNGQPEEADRAVLLQNREAGLGGAFGESLPGFWGVRTPRWKYLDHNLSAGRPGATKRPEELYDLQADPFELNNLAGNRAFDRVLRTMRARLLELQTRPAQK
jgi:N-acetylglucosamine-6-sulfatase